MANVAHVRSRLPRRTRRAVDIAHRKRRDSHRGYPDLLQTHNVAIGASLPVPDHFPVPDRAVTFKFRIDRTLATATGNIVSLGDQGSIGFQGGDLRVVTGGGSPDTFLGTFAGAPRDSAEVVVALQPTTGRVCAWVDSDPAVIGSTVATFPYSWATSGVVDYDSIAGAVVRSNLDIFVFQLPRHFGQHGAAQPPAVDDLLFRAAIMTNLATSSVPFTDTEC